MGEKASFIGLGHMGSSIASSLLKKGVDLAVYNRTKEKAQPLVQEGAKLLEHPSQAFAHAPVVFSMVANDAALHDIVEGPNGLLQQVKPGFIHVSLSTIAPDTAQKMIELHHKKGVAFLGSPVFGRPDVATRGELNICIAGDQSAKKSVEPLLKLFSKGIYDFGTNPADALHVKIMGNFMILSVIELLSEVYAYSEKQGIPTKDIYHLFTNTLFSAPIFQIYGKIILDKAFSPAGFQLPLGLKDLNLFRAAADKINYSSPIADLLHQRMLVSLAKQRSELDWSAISMISRENAGLP